MMVRFTSLRVVRKGDLADGKELKLAVEEFLMYLNTSDAVGTFEPALLFNKSKVITS